MRGPMPDNPEATSWGFRCPDCLVERTGFRTKGDAQAIWSRDHLLCRLNPRTP